MKKLLDLLFTGIGRKITGTILWGLLILSIVFKPSHPFLFGDYVFISYAIWRLVGQWLAKTVTESRPYQLIESCLMVIVGICIFWAGYCLYFNI